LLCTEFVQYLNNSKESNVFLILVDFDKHDKHTVNQFQKSKLFLALKDIAIIESHFKLKPWEMNEIKSFVLKTSQKYNLSFNADSLNMFCECFSDKTEQIPSEIYKIYTYLLPDSKITKNVLDNLYSNNLNLDDLISCFLKSTYDGVFDDMDKIKKLLPPVYIISVMQSKIRQCFQIKTLLSFGLNQSIISSNLGIHPYKLKLTIQSLTDVSLMDIKKCLNHLSVIEYKLKTGIIKDSNILDMLIAA